jgi:hypothetical protein
MKCWQYHLFSIRVIQQKLNSIFVHQNKYSCYNPYYNVVIAQQSGHNLVLQNATKLSKKLIMPLNYIKYSYMTVQGEVKPATPGPVTEHIATIPDHFI